MSPRGIYKRPPKESVTDEPDDVEEEMTELEVQQALEAQDPKPFVPEQPVVDISSVHALESAPVGSKIVVVEEPTGRFSRNRSAILAGPDGQKVLPEGDPAHKLPAGAKITKTSGGFLIEQLGAHLEQKPLMLKSANEAIARFLPYFHDVK